jgi:hypothetical protein
LAIQADATSGYVLHESFTRHFGVWRESESGRRVLFDPLFPKGTPLPAAGEAPVQITRRYSPVHNVGHFRYLECSHLTDDGRPTGDITVWDEILFPFDPSLIEEKDLSAVQVHYSLPAEAQQIEERYSCYASGTVEVQISNKTSNDARTFRLGRWGARTEPVVPGRKRKVKAEGR